MDTDEEDRIFRELTEDYYDTFILYSQFCSEEYEIDKDTKVKIFGLRGYVDAVIVVHRKTDNTFWAAVDDGLYINYFTNDSPYSAIPKPITDWCNPEHNTNWVITNRKNTWQDNSLQIPEVYMELLEQQGYDAYYDGGIVFYTKKDMDTDGFDEVIIATGINASDPFSSYISNIYVYREKDGNPEQLGENLAQSGYGVYKIMLIRLQDMPNEYIYLGLTNGAGLTGFRIVEISGDHVAEFYYSASATGVGSDSLIDRNEDNQYDTVLQSRYSYDVLYYHVERLYVLENGKFVLNGMDVDIPAYPATVEDTILQFISLKALGVGISGDADIRLQELCRCGVPEGLSFSSDDWYEAILNTILGIGNSIAFDTVEDGNTVNVTLSFASDEGKEYKCLFRVTEQNERWVIDSIEPL